MASYKLLASRWLRKYSEAKSSPVYATETEAAYISAHLCEVPWKRVAARDATMTWHTNEIVHSEGDPEHPKTWTGLDWNVVIRDEFDAALFCSDHVSGGHRARANAACYRYVLPDGAVGRTLEQVVASVTSDPYNAVGARLAILTNSTGEIPMDCGLCRNGGRLVGSSYVQDASYHTPDGGVVKRRVETAADGSETWYPVTADVTLNPTGFTLQKYLFVFVLLENYNFARGNWLEGSSFAANSIRFTLDQQVEGWSEDELVDCSNVEDDVGVTSVDIVRDGVVADIVGNTGVVASVTALASGTVPRLDADRNASVLPQVKDEMQAKNLCSGIATIVGRFGAGLADVAPLGTTNPLFRNRGVGFCIRSSTDLKFVNAVGDEANPRSVCITMSSLMVPFGLDAGVEMEYAKFDWTYWLETASVPPGARFSFWLRPGKLEEAHPDMSNPSFYRADVQNIGDWRLLSSEPVESGLATVDLMQANGNPVSGQNTILVTAFVPASSVNPDNVDDFSQGIGSFWYNSVTPDRSVSINVELYPAFSEAEAYRKGAEVSYGTNLLKKWTKAPGASGAVDFTYRGGLDIARHVAFGTSGILWSPDGFEWSRSNITSAVKLVGAFDVSGLTVAILSSGIKRTTYDTVATNPKDGSFWENVFSPGSPIRCFDRTSSHGTVIGTSAGAYVAASYEAEYIESSWESVGLPAVPVNGIAIAASDSVVYATDKGIFRNLGIANLPTRLKSVRGTAGQSLVFTDAGLFRRNGELWFSTNLRGNVQTGCTDGPVWVAAVDGVIAYSKDLGGTWVKTEVVGEILGIAYKAGTWVATGTDILAWSTDAVEWTLVPEITGTCPKAIRFDPYWAAGYDEFTMVSEDGKEWSKIETGGIRGSRGLYETERGAFAKMGIAYGDNGMFRVIFNDTGYLMLNCTYRKRFTQGGSLSYDIPTLGIRVYDACTYTVEGDDHIIAAGSEGLLVLDIADDSYLDSHWTQIFSSDLMGTVVQVMSGSADPTVYMLARSISGTVYRYGTDILSQTVPPRREVAGVYEYNFRPANGRWMNADYTPPAGQTDAKLAVRIDYGDHETGNWVYSIYEKSNDAFPVDDDGYNVFYDESGIRHRFKITVDEPTGATMTPHLLHLSFADGDSWSEDLFDKMVVVDTYSSNGMYTPAQAAWTSREGYTTSGFWFRQFVTYNDDHSKMYLNRFAARLSCTYEPDTSDVFTIYTAEGGSANVTANADHTLTVADGATWRDVNSISGSATPQLPSVDFIMSGSGKDYAFAGNKVYVSSSNGRTWAEADTLVDHPPFVSVKYNGGLLLAVDSAGAVVQSVDSGRTWTAYDPPVSNPVFRVANGMWFATGDEGTAMSADARSWSAVVPELTGVTDVKFAGNVYACSCPNGVFRSVDGVRWTRLSDRTDVVSLRYEDGIWTAATTDGIVLSSDNPMFAARGIPSAPISGFNKLYAYNNGNTVIGCSSDMSGLWYSTDGGTTWKQSNVTSGEFTDVVSSGSTYVAVGPAGVYRGTYSTWTKVDSLEGGFNAVAYGNGRFVAIGTTGLFYSSNGTTWTNPFPPFTAITFGGYATETVSYSTRYIGYKWAAVNSNGLYYSNDSKSWYKVAGTSGTFSNVTRTRNTGYLAHTGAYIVAYASSSTWYASESDLSVWTQFTSLSGFKYTVVDKTPSGWIAARSSTLQTSTDGVGWSTLASPGVGTIVDVIVRKPSSSEIIIVAGTSGLAISTDGGSTWTKQTIVTGSVKALVPGQSDVTSIYSSLIVIGTDGNAYAINLYNGSSFTPIVSKIAVPGKEDLKFKAAANGGYNGGYFYIQAEDNTIYAVSASSDFYDPESRFSRPSYSEYTGVESTLGGIADSSGDGMVLYAEDGIYRTRVNGYQNGSFSKVADSSGKLVAMAASAAGTTELFFAVEASGRMYKATDHQNNTWEIAGNGMSSSMSVVAYSGSYWLASGSKTLKSTNGTTWTDVESGISDATAVAISSANIILVGKTGFAYSTDSGATWTSGTTLKDANSVKLIDSRWYACTSSGIYTAEASDISTWTGRYNGAIKSTDVAKIGSKFVATCYGSSSPYLAVSDDGTTWTTKYAASTSPMYGNDLSTIIASGAKALISGTAGTYESSDMSSWTVKTFSEAPLVYSIEEFERYLVACTDQGVFYSTTGGTSWRSSNLHSGVFRASAYSNSSGSYVTVVVGELGIFKANSSNANLALSFSPVSNDAGFMSLGFTDVARGDGTRWAAVCGTGLYTAPVSGTGWSKDYSGSFRTVVGRESTIIAAGSAGICVSSDGGATWTLSFTPGADYSHVSKVGSVWIATPGEGSIFAHTYLGVKAYFSKDGYTWKTGDIDFGDRAGDLAGYVVCTDAVTDGSRLFFGLRSGAAFAESAHSLNGVYYSDDNGRSWSQCPGTSSSNVYSIAYDSSTGILYAVLGSNGKQTYDDDAGGILYSKDRGATWNRLGVPGDAVYNSTYRRTVLAKGLLWLFYAYFLADANVSCSRAGTGKVESVDAYRSKEDQIPSEFDYDKWDLIENPVRDRFSGASTLCIPDITLHCARM